MNQDFPGSDLICVMNLLADLRQATPSQPIILTWKTILWYTNANIRVVMKRKTWGTLAVEMAKCCSPKYFCQMCSSWVSAYSFHFGLVSVNYKLSSYNPGIVMRSFLKKWRKKIQVIKNRLRFASRLLFWFQQSVFSIVFEELNKLRFIGTWTTELFLRLIPENCSSCLAQGRSAIWAFFE